MKDGDAIPRQKFASPNRRRGRPPVDPLEASARQGRLQMFGSRLRAMRDCVGMSAAEVAERAGLTSSRQVGQYETSCYPPGWVIPRLAAIYGVDAAWLGWFCLKCKSPDLFDLLAPAAPEDLIRDLET